MINFLTAQQSFLKKTKPRETIHIYNKYKIMKEFFPIRPKMFFKLLMLLSFILKRKR